jgi:NAD-dependent dihydropyrimidine dehydrogenase PreA subunit
MKRKANGEKPDRGRIEIYTNQCKGCGLCIAVCPVTVINFAEIINSQGYRPAVYLGSGCTGCGICFYVCPEPGAITVYKTDVAPTLVRLPGQTEGVGPEQVADRSVRHEHVQAIC